MVLYADTVPRTAINFMTLCTGKQKSRNELERFRRLCKEEQNRIEKARTEHIQNRTEPNGKEQNRTEQNRKERTEDTFKLDEGRRIEQERVNKEIRIEQQGKYEEQKSVIQKNMI